MGWRQLTFGAAWKTKKTHLKNHLFLGAGNHEWRKTYFLFFCLYFLGLLEAKQKKNREKKMVKAMAVQRTVDNYRATAFWDGGVFFLRLWMVNNSPKQKKKKSVFSSPVNFLYSSSLWLAWSQVAAFSQKQRSLHKPPIYKCCVRLQKQKANTNAFLSTLTPCVEMTTRHRLRVFFKKKQRARWGFFF